MTENEEIIRSYMKEIKHHLLSIFSIGIILVSFATVIMFQYLFYYHARASYISKEITIIEEDND